MTVLRCDDCYYHDTWRLFAARGVVYTVSGTDHLSPQTIPPEEVADLVIDGWTVTEHHLHLEGR